MLHTSVTVKAPVRVPGDGNWEYLLILDFLKSVLQFCRKFRFMIIKSVCFTKAILPTTLSCLHMFVTSSQYLVINILM